MPWVTIKGNQYYRRSRRVDGRVRTEHVGAGPLAEQAAELDADARALRRTDRERAGRLTADITGVMAVDQLLAGLVAVAAAAAGIYRHRRQWRKGRGADMGQKTGSQAVDALLGRPDRMPPLRPLLPPDLSGVPAADRATLTRAAVGDEQALAAAEKYLADPAFVNRWGNPVTAARAWLVMQIAGTDELVAQATDRRLAALAHNLGYDTAGPLEQLAITRVLHNWLSVYLLEGKAGRLAVGGRERVAAERCLTLADRRFQQSLKTLAFLRGELAAGLVARLTTAEPVLLAPGEPRPG